MIVTLAPVHVARSELEPPLAPGEVHPELSQTRDPLFGDPIAILYLDDHPLIHEGSGESHPQLSGQVVIAGAREADSSSCSRLAPGTNGFGGGEQGQGLNGAHDLGPCHSEVAVLAPALDLQESALYQLGQVRTGCGGSHSGHPRHPPGAQRSAVREGEKDARPCLICHQRSYRRDVRVAAVVYVGLRCLHFAISSIPVAYLRERLYLWVVSRFVESSTFRCLSR